jgi:hypothetical protein
MPHGILRAWCKSTAETVVMVEMVAMEMVAMEMVARAAREGVEKVHHTWLVGDPGQLSLSQLSS